MGTPFLSEIRIMSFDFAPEGLGAVQRPAPADQPEPGALLAARARPTAATVGPTSPCPTCAAACPSTSGSGHTLGERGGEQAHTLIDRRDAARTPTPLRRRRTRRRHASVPTGNARWPASRRRSTGRRTQPDRARPGSRHQRRREPGAPEHAAVPDPELLHRAAGHLPVPELRRATMAQPYVGEIRMFAGNFAPAGLDVLRRPAAAHLGERDAVPADRHDLRRRRRVDLRAARPARAGPDPPGRNGLSSWPRPAASEEVTLTVQPDPGPHAPAPRSTASARTRARGNGPSPVRARRTSICTSQDGADANMCPQAIGSGRRQPAARQLPALPVRRTSSSRSSASSRPRPRRTPMADPFVAEIRIFPFNFAPRGWAFCDGQLLPHLARTRRSSRSWARPMAATARAPSRCPTCRAARRCTRARDRGSRCTTSARPAGARP